MNQPWKYRHGDNLETPLVSRKTVRKVSRQITRCTGCRKSEEINKMKQSSPLYSAYKCLDNSRLDVVSHLPDIEFRRVSVVLEVYKSRSHKTRPTKTRSPLHFPQLISPRIFRYPKKGRSIHISLDMSRWMLSPVIGYDETVCIISAFRPSAWIRDSNVP